MEKHSQTIIKDRFTSRKNPKESRAEKQRESSEGGRGYVHIPLNLRTVISSWTVSGSWSKGRNMNSESLIKNEMVFAEFLAVCVVLGSSGGHLELSDHALADVCASVS